MIVSSPVVMIGSGISLLLAATKVLIQERRIIEVVPYANANIDSPAKWDDSEITRLLQRHQDQPAVLSHAVASIKKRLILNQDLKTAQQRLKLVTSVIEVFKLNKELQGLMQDLALAEKDFEIRQLETQIRLEDAKDRLKAEQLLRKLRVERDELLLQKEIAQLRHDTDAIQTPKPDAQLTEEQRRRLKRMEIEDKLRELDRLEEEALKNARDEDDRMRIQNMYYDKREELREQLAKNLI